MEDGFDLAQAVLESLTATNIVESSSISDLFDNADSANGCLQDSDQEETKLKWQNTDGVSSNHPVLSW